jgi:hypothetical protein
MLESLRRLLNKGPKSADLSPLQGWAESNKLQFKRIRDQEGCLIEPLPTAASTGSGELGWRIEWGDSQRSYITTREVRFSADVGTPREMLALVLNRELMETMEKAVFEQYVEDVQTRIDTETPPEMRWLVMFPKLANNELGRLKDRYAAVASIKPWLQLWLSNALEEALVDTPDNTSASSPVVIVINRGRMTMRTAMAVPDAEILQRWFTVFMRIMPVARKLARDWTDATAGGATGTLQPSVWPPSKPDEG